MAYSIGVDGVWKKVRAVWISPVASWRRVLGRWVAVDGEWKLKFRGGLLQLVPATIRSFCYSPDIPVSSITFNPDGSQMAAYTDQTVAGSKRLVDWFDPGSAGIGANFEIRAVVVSGIAGAVSGSAVGQWLSLGAARSWSVEGVPNALNQTRAATLEISIRSKGGTDPEVTTQIGLSAVAYARSNPNSNYGKGGGVDTSSIDRFNQL